MSRSVFRHLAALSLLLLACAALLWHRQITNLYRFSTLFSAIGIVENFRTMPDHWPARVVHHSGAPSELTAAPVALPRTFFYRGAERDLDEFLERRATTGLLVSSHDRVTAERYFLGNTAQTRSISWSVCKSFVSALVGIAIGEGKIRSIDDPVTDYARQLHGSGYDGVHIKDVLQMSSGIRFREDYGDITSDINRMGIDLALGTPLGRFVASLTNERPPGTYNRYVSMDTQVIGMVLTAATGTNLSNYLEEKIWSRIGAESDAYWLVDGEGMEWAFGGLNVTLRDYARFGRLYLRGGDWNGQRLVPAQWVHASVTPDAPHLMPGKNPASDSRFGYGYQWWIPEAAGAEGTGKPSSEFLAIGVYGQYIYVSPDDALVIVKTSADRDFQTDDYESDFETLAAFRAIALSLAERGKSRVPANPPR